jgi:Rrf2 family protein
MFSKATEYALRATIFIAQKGANEKKIGIEEISKAIDSPPSFTAKILQALRRDNKVLQSVTGPNGGFFITDRARRQPVRTIIDAMDEGEVLEKCVLGLNKCSEAKPCPMHAQYKLIKVQLIKLFELKTIQDLADDIRNGDVYISNTRKR